MPALADVPEAVERAMAAQRSRTEEALKRGVPHEAATEEQRKAREAYTATHWPELNLVPEGFVGKDDTLWSNFLARGGKCARAVARVVWKDRPAESRWQGTAFLISEWLAITNQHVLESAAAAAAAALQFDYEYDEEGNERPGRMIELDPDRLFITDRRPGETDYTVVAVKSLRSASPARRRGFLPLIVARGKAQNGDPLNLIHHPSGLRKRVTVRESRLLGMDDYTLHYSGDTLGGSSGAPVLNDQWEVVGLHFGGRPKRDEEGRRLNINGEAWDPSMPKESLAYEYNVGARASVLVRELRERSQSLGGDGRELLINAIGGEQ